MGKSDIIYRIDEQDRITFVSEAWDRFALENNSAHLESGSVLNRSLWDFLSDVGTREIYRDMLKLARQGRSFRFTFRCDSPELLRLLEMQVARWNGDTVEFRTWTLNVEPRDHQPLLDIETPRLSQFLKVCAWCKKAWVCEQWVELEDAFVQLRLHEQHSLPELTHAMCEPCLAQMTHALDNA